MSKFLALFDLDGTLVDSAPDITNALNLALTGSSLPTVGEKNTRSYIGDGSKRLVHRAITKTRKGIAETNLFNRVFKEFENNYAKDVFTRSKTYPHVVDALNKLQNYKVCLGCITNKPYDFTIPLLKAAGLFDYFQIILGGDSLPHRKPNPAPIMHAIDELGGCKKTTVMIGDSITDLNAAKNAGVKSVCVTYGYSGDIDLAKYKPDKMINTMDELPSSIISLFECPDKNRLS